MKKILFILATALAVTFTSCSKDDEFNTPTIVGTWEETHDADDYYLVYVFNSDGAFLETEYYKNGNKIQRGIKGTYTMQDGNITLTYSDGHVEVIPYSFSDDTLNLGKYSYTKI